MRKNQCPTRGTWHRRTGAAQVWISHHGGRCTAVHRHTVRCEIASTSAMSMRRRSKRRRKRTGGRAGALAGVLGQEGNW